MVRGKVQMKRIENPVHRQVTFCKRRAGLLKKARELSVLCDAEIGLLIISDHGKLYELATKGTMQELIEKYMKSSGGHRRGDQPDDHMTMEMSQNLDVVKEEVHMLKQEIDTLQKCLSRYMFEGAIEVGTMPLDELLLLEKHLELRICHTRSAKMDIMLQEMQSLRDKEGMLKALNTLLQEKVQESIGAVTNFAPLVEAVMPDPLTLPNEIFQF
ncbi:hypothetical protein SLE2022_310310 [Rubroshorea leprosula]